MRPGRSFPAASLPSFLVKSPSAGDTHWQAGSGGRPHRSSWASLEFAFRFKDSYALAVPLTIPWP